MMPITVRGVLRRESRSMPTTIETMSIAGTANAIESDAIPRRDLCFAVQAIPGLGSSFVNQS